MDKATVLKQYFGHTTFRPGQEKLIDSLLAGRDVLGVMPTGQENLFVIRPPHCYFPI